MSKNKETLMYVGGKPKKNTDSKNSSTVDTREDWEKKWDKIVSGETTIKEQGEHFTEGNIEALRKGKVGKVVGFSGKLDRMRVLTVHVGYSKEEMESKAFQDYMKRTKTEIENTFGKKNIEVGFHIPDKETPSISSYGFAHMILADPEECAVLKRRLQKDVGAIDLVDVRINPQVAKTDYFGLGGEITSTPGPIKDQSGKYKLPYKFLVEHELMHSISRNGNKHNPTYFGDGYIHNLYDFEGRDILSGNNLEFIPAGKDGKPIEGGSDTMKKALKLTNPVDENVFMVDKEGNKYKLLTINSGTNIMRFSFTNEERSQAIKDGNYISPAQRVAIDDVIKDYLIGEKRLDADKAIQKPKMIVKNNNAKVAVNISQKISTGQRT